MYKTTNKIIASMLVLILTLAQLSLIGIYGKEVYATDSDLENQTTKTNNVEFDAYFIDAENEVHTATKKISDANSIYARINVANTGYLKDAQIEFKGVNEEDANFKILNKTQNTIIQKIDEENSIVTLNQINSKEEQILEIPITFNYSEEILASELSRQSKAVLTATYIDGDGKENKIEKEILVKLNWTEEAKAVLEEDVTAFIPYAVESEEGILVQTTVQTSAQNNTLPVKTTTIESIVPKINGLSPTSIKVYANSTKATNGQESDIEFSSENYVYNEESNTLTITVQNAIDGNGKIRWLKEATDEYKITYIYPKEVKEYVASEDFGAKIELETKVTIQLYDSNQTKVMKTVTQYDYYKDQLGNTNEISIENKQQSLSKGYIYANYVAQNKVETNFSQAIVAEVLDAQLADKIVVEQSEEYFMTSDEQTKYSTAVEGNNYTYYKTISINKNEIIKILGLDEDTEINVYSGETLIETIDKEKIEEAEETITIDLSTQNINSIKIETNKPEAEGQLIFNIEKAIRGTIGYTKEQMKTVQKMVTYIKSTVNGEEITASSEVAFTEPQDKAEISISKENLSTILKNEDVKFEITLRTDSVDNNLFKNPTITIQLPQYIEKVEITDKDILFDEELKITSVTTVENGDGTQSIVIQLDGEQTKYNIDSVTGGTNIVITADLTVNRLTSNRTEQITMYYTNENSAETKQEVINVNFVAPVGVIATNSIDGYAEGKEKLTVISGEGITAELTAMQETKEATFNMNVINNYNNTVDSVKILGRLPFKGNKGLVDQEDLGSTFDITLKSAITVSGIDESRVKVYYSTNKEATTDLDKTSNGWTTTVENYETVKSYLITIDGTLNTADMISFSYTAQIPEGLQYNETSVESYIVYFNNNLETGTIQDKQLAAPITITTGLGPILETTIESNYTEDQVVAVGKYIDYTIKVTNKGTLDAEDAIISIELPENTKQAVYSQENDTYIVDYESENVSIDAGIIKQGETVEKKLTLKIISISSTEQGNIEKVKISAKVTAINIASEVESNIVVNSITQPYYNISNNPIENYGDLSEGEEFEFEVMILTTGNVSENTIVKIPLTNNLLFQSAKITTYNYVTMEQEELDTKINYNENDNIIEINVGKVTDSLSAMVTIKVKVGKLEENEYKAVVPTYAQVSGDNIKEETSEIKEYIITKIGLEVKQTSNIPNTTSIQSGDKLTYVITIKNIGERVATITLEDKIPTGLSFTNMEYTIEEETKSSTVINNNTIEQYLNLEIGKTVTIKINTIAEIVDENTSIVNKPIIKIEGLEDVQVNSITHIIEKFEIPIYNGDTQKPDLTSNNKISGIIWEDTNKNGMYDNDEKIFEGIEVLLLDMNTNKLHEQNVKTNENGIYTFTNVPKGTYIVIFLYDSGKYSATAYKAEGIEENINSDAIDTKIILDGETLNVAITNNITVEDKSIYNIDLGLIENPKFDLKINKSISKITVQDPTGIKTYEYSENTGLTKVEFEERYLGQITIIVEYKIAVTNEGAIDGYVKKIADYMPSEMSFNSELNRDWYMNENGTIYNASLANTKIQPGETKEVTLVLIKTINENSLGTINNTAEIYEVYNDKMLGDSDSTPANKASNEDDLSSADLVLSIKTGKVVTFIGLTLSIIVIIGASAYFIKKKVLK